MPDTLVYTRSDGLVLDLSDNVNYKFRHHEGFGIGDFDHTAVDVPTLDGDYWFGTRFKTRTVTVDIVINATNLASLQTKRGQLLSALNPHPYSGKLTLTQSNGVVRCLDCVLSSTLPMPTSQHIGRAHMALSLQFRSVGSPFLYDPVQQSTTITPSGGGFTFPWQFPFVLAQSQIYAAPVINNPGDVPTPVEINLTGPALNPIFQNSTTGQTFSFSGGLANVDINPGGILYINTDPRKRRVQLYGVDAWDKLVAADFWGLNAGANNLFFDIGNTTVATSLVISWFNRYLGV
jgi:hypothetical protein